MRRSRCAAAADILSRDFAAGFLASARRRRRQRRRRQQLVGGGPKLFRQTNILSTYSNF
jgi:hypothetical protein